eukprot:symbB.v1.2.027594.t1/scaffold2834.1/size69276/1
MTPTLLHATILESENVRVSWLSLRYLSCSGECFPRPLFQKLLRLLPTCCVLNLYGSTEVAGDASCAALPEEDLEGNTAATAPVPCGRAIDGVQVELRKVDVGESESLAASEVCGLGEEGEVFISGACLSPGYLDDTDATSNAFVTDEKGRSLRSFDVGRWEMSKMSEKTLVILGRSNHMVKIRGHRVELSLVEATLTSEALTQEMAGHQRHAGTDGPCRPIFKEACCCVLEDLGIEKET